MSGVCGRGHVYEPVAMGILHYVWQRAQTGSGSAMARNGLQPADLPAGAQIAPLCDRFSGKPACALILESGLLWRCCDFMHVET